MMKNLKIALCLSSTLLISTVAHAQWMTNALVGVSGGWGQTDGNLNYYQQEPAPGNQITAFPTKLKNNGWVWGLLAGYQGRCNGWLLGGEVNVDWQHKSKVNNFAFVDTVNDSWIGSAQFKREPTVGLTGRLGYEVSEFLLPYIRLGVETSRDKLAYSGTDFTSNPTIYVSHEGNRRSYRFVGGAGVEMPVPMVTGLSFRAEYAYHAKGREVGATSFASDNATLVSTSTKQHNNTVKGALVWNFGA